MENVPTVEPWDSCWQVDESGRILHADEEFGKYILRNDTSGATDEVVGRFLTDFIPCPQTARIFHSILDRVRFHSVTLELPYRHDMPDKRRYLLMRIEPIDGGRKIQICSRTIREESREPVALLSSRSESSQTDEAVKICSWCNMVLTGKGWLEVEEALKHLEIPDNEYLPDLEHTLCERCQIDVISSAFIVS